MRNFKNRTYRVPVPDPVYRSRLVSLLINKVMKDGKKTVAQKIVYKALKKVIYLLTEDEDTVKTMKKLGLKFEKNPALLLERCVKKLTPLVVTRIHRWRGGRGRKGHLYRMSVYKKACFSIRWIILGAKVRCKKRKVRKLSGYLAEEIVELLTGKGNSIKLKEECDEIASEFIHFYFPKRVLKQAPDSHTRHLEYYFRISKYNAKKKSFLK